MVLVRAPRPDRRTTALVTTALQRTDFTTEVTMRSVPVRGRRRPSAVSRRVVGDTLVVVSVLRLAGVVLMVPPVLTVDRRFGLAALALTTMVVAGQLTVWPFLSERACAVPGMLATDVGAGAAILSFDGVGLPLADHLLGMVVVAAALLGVAGVGLAAVVGAGFGFLLADGSDGTATATTMAASVPVHFVLWAFLAAVVRHVLVKRERGRCLLRRRNRDEAAAEERSRLARELHDSAAKTVVGISLSATSLRRLVVGGDAAGRARRVADDIAVAAEAAATELRGVIAGLREPFRDERDVGVPLVQALDRLVTAWGEREGVRTLVSVPADLALDAGAGGVALAIVEECLTNVQRHAGAGLVEVRGRSDATQVVLEVADDGDGFAVPASPQELVAGNHFGLVGMTERARLAGGDLRLASGAGGTTVSLVLPVARALAAAPRRSRAPGRARPPSRPGVDAAPPVGEERSNPGSSAVRGRTGHRREMA